MFKFLVIFSKFYLASLWRETSSAISGMSFRAIELQIWCLEPILNFQILPNFWCFFNLFLQHLLWPKSDPDTIDHLQGLYLLWENQPNLKKKCTFWILKNWLFSSAFSTSGLSFCQNQGPLWGYLVAESEQDPRKSRVKKLIFQKPKNKKNSISRQHCLGPWIRQVLSEF